MYQMTDLQNKVELETLRQLCRPGDNVLWVASAGGHLAEAKKLHDMMEFGFNSTWVTFDSEQSQSLLSGESMVTVDYVRPRGLLSMAKAGFTAHRVLSEEHYDLVISTGAAVAVPFLVEAVVRGIRAVYVESLTRTSGPSMTGKIAQLIPYVQTYSQYESWSSSNWRYGGSILDNWEVTHNQSVTDSQLPLRTVVSLGTIRPYRFDRAVDSLKKVLAGEDKTTWQLGATERHDISEPHHESLPWSELGKLIQDSDVYVCHAGVGSVLQALDHGKIPVLIVRDSLHNEHVDDHQLDFANEISRRGIGLVLDIENPDRNTLLKAKSMNSKERKGAA